MIEITDNGLEKMSLEENLEYVFNVIKGEKGNNVDLSPTGPWGQIAAILAKFISDNDDEQEEIYLSRDPDNATGIAQDKLSSETGTYRREASKTVVLDVLLRGDEGTVIEEGKQTGQAIEFEPVEGLYFELDNDVIISKNYVRKVVFSIEEPSTGKVYTLTLDGSDYGYTALVTDTIPDIITELIAVLPAGISGNNVDNTLVLFSQSDFTLLFTSTLVMEELWCAGDFSATITGPNIVISESLTEIVTPVSGWLEVNNPSSGIVGLERETDSSLIIRRKNELIKGKGTDAAIRNAIANLDNVILSYVVSNRTGSISGDGLPAHSFAAVVFGGIDDDIAQAIFDNMPAGIPPFGNTYGIAVDDEGVEYEIDFSRPVVTYIHVKYTRVQHPEEDYPTDGDTQVKTKLLTWVDANIGIGTDIVRQKLETPFFEVLGSQSVITEFAETVSPGDTPSWSSASLISIIASKIADFAEDRIFVVTP